MVYWQAALTNCEATPFPTVLSAVQLPVADATAQY